MHNLDKLLLEKKAFRDEVDER